MELTCIPKTFRELQRFYGEVFSPLYDRFMTSGAVAQELHDYAIPTVFSDEQKENPTA